MKGIVKLRITLMMFRDISTKEDDELVEQILHAISYLEQLENDQMAAAYFETLMRYIFFSKKAERGTW